MRVLQGRTAEEGVLDARGKRQKSGADFFAFIARNPLKSHDHKK
jgi:hypothetical protein